VEPAPEAPGFLDRPGLMDTGRTVLMIGLVLVIAFMVIRPIMRGLGVGDGGGGGGMAMSAGRLPGGGMATAAARASLSYDDKVSVARQLAEKNPERVAQIVRAWVQSDE